MPGLGKELVSYLYQPLQKYHNCTFIAALHSRGGYLGLLPIVGLYSQKLWSANVFGLGLRQLKRSCWGKKKGMIP